MLMLRGEEKSDMVFSCFFFPVVACRTLRAEMSLFFLEFFNVFAFTEREVARSTLEAIRMLSKLVRGLPGLASKETSGSSDILRTLVPRSSLTCFASI